MLKGMPRTNTWVRALPAAAAVLAAIPVAILAQWPNYPSARVPRGPDGKVILDAPAPNAADGRPDLSGIWAFKGGGFGKQAAKQPQPEGAPPLANFKNLGAGFKGGLPLEPWAAELLRARREQNSKDNPDAHCLPLGLMQHHTHPQPRKIIQTPALVVILFEAQAGVRQIFLDGRPLPNNDPQPWWYGYSTGKWEQDELVVETSGFRDDVWLDIDGSPLTGAGKMTERFRRPNYGTLEIDVTIEDPKVYTKPFTVRVVQRIMPDTDLIEFICNENDTSGPHLVGK
jgi:hypothetical protein